MSTVTLRHGLVDLALHHLRGGSGPTLLLLHGLGEQTPDTPPASVAAWPGPIYGLDLTGHGRSSSTRGGGFTAELLMADVDIALAELGPATILGRGLGGYVALLIAGARPELVRGAVVADGPGIAGGGPAAQAPVLVQMRSSSATPDPFALAELARDVRPPDYATSYLRQAVQFSGLEVPLVVAARVRPPWLAALVEEPGVAVDADVAAALARYQGAEVSASGR